MARTTPKFSQLRSPAGYRRARDYHMASARWCQEALATGCYPAGSYDAGKPIASNSLANLKIEGLPQAVRAARSWNHRIVRALRARSAP